MISTVLGGCVDQVNQPIFAGRFPQSAGLPPSGSAASYWYARTAGYRLVYINVDSAFLNGPSNPPTIYVGSCDTLRTLGYRMLAPNGDSLYAVEITYQVLSSYSGRTTVQLPYVPPDSSFGGAFVDGTSTLSGELPGLNPIARGVAYDSMAGGNAGRIKWLTYGLGSFGSRVWQKDTIIFSSIGDSVALWNRPTGYTSDVPFRQIFVRNFTPSDGWRNGSGTDSTTFTVENADTSITVPAGTYPDAASMRVATSQFNLPVVEYKFFAQSVGLVKQQDNWWATADGSARTYHITIHELGIVVKDDLED